MEHQRLLTALFAGMPRESDRFGISLLLQGLQVFGTALFRMIVPSRFLDEYCLLEV